MLVSIAIQNLNVNFFYYDLGSTEPGVVPRKKNGKSRVPQKHTILDSIWRKCTIFSHFFFSFYENNAM